MRRLVAIGRRSFLVLIGTIVTLLIVAVAADLLLDEPIRRKIEREMNAALNGYTVRIPKADFHVFGASIDLENMRVIQNAHPDPPVALFPKLSASVQWGALFHLRLVADFILDRPQVHLNLPQLAEEAKDPVSENPSTSHVVTPRPLRNASTCVAIGRTVWGTVPVERPMPALSNRMTSRPDASGSVTAGSQLSNVPVKCWRHSRGKLGPLPKRRYAYVSSLVSMNCVGAVVLLASVISNLSRNDLEPRRGVEGGHQHVHRNHMRVAEDSREHRHDCEGRGRGQGEPTVDPAGRGFHGHRYVSSGLPYRIVQIAT